MSEARARKLVGCILEAVGTAAAQGEGLQLKRLAEEIGCSLSDLQAAIGIARSEGFVTSENDILTLTNKGEEEVKKHREDYVHKKYAHRGGLLGRISKHLEGRVGNRGSHWHHRHGMNGESRNTLYSHLQTVRGRIEDAVPLATLRQGEKGVVTFALGGHGLLRRLAEMGLTPGTEVTVVKQAPFRGPVEIIVRGVSLVLGRGVAMKVFVKTAG